MKKLVVAGYLAAALLGVFVATGKAQLTRRYTAKIPFDFTVGNKRYEAGEYTIAPLSSVTNLRALVLRSAATGKVRTIGQALVLASDSTKPDKMIFAKAGDGWVLQSIETSTFSLKLGKRFKLEKNDVASDIYSSETRTVSIGN